MPCRLFSLKHGEVAFQQGRHAQLADRFGQFEPVSKFSLRPLRITNAHRAHRRDEMYPASALARMKLLNNLKLALSGLLIWLTVDTDC